MFCDKRKESTMAILWVLIKWLAIGMGMLCSVVALGVGVLTVAALLMGAAWDEHEDPTDEACEWRTEECRHMAAGLCGESHHRGTESTEKSGLKCEV
jgi:hypothetical protein